MEPRYETVGSAFIMRQLSITGPGAEYSSTVIVTTYLRKYSFSVRITNVWNSSVLSVPFLGPFKNPKDGERRRNRPVDLRSIVLGA